MNPNLHEVLSVWALSLAVDVLRYGLFALPAFGLFWVWRREKFVHRSIQDRRPKRDRLVHEFKYSMLTAFIFSCTGVTLFCLVRAGVTQSYERVSEHGWAYWFFSIAAAIVIHDAYFYWTHRLMHTRWLFRYAHRVHHMSTNPSPLAAYSFGPLEAFINSLIAPLLVFLIPMHELALFTAMIFMIAMNVMGHLGIELFPRGWTRGRVSGLLNTSTHHNLHHSRFHGNYGLYFTYWDRWMGTEVADYHETFEMITNKDGARRRAHEAISRGVHS